LGDKTTNGIKMLTKELIENRIKNFWGYGSLDAPVWFVGMEEGLADTKGLELEDRFIATDGMATVDIRKGMKNLPTHMKFFSGTNSPIQSTWKYPIWLFLYIATGKKPTKEEIRDYQVYNLGDIELRETACIELMPLPSRKASEETWLYSGYGIDGLESRAEYLKKYKPQRVRELKRLIEEHKPKIIIFYSIGYLEDWTEIIGKKPEEITRQMYYTKNSERGFIVIPQGASFGMSYDRLAEFLDKVKKKEEKEPKLVYEYSANLPEEERQRCLDKAYDILFTAGMRMINAEKEKNKE